MIKDYQLKHLDIIQGVINRLAGNSFLIKGWSITIALAGFGFFINSTNNPIFLVLIAYSAFIFWLLDGYYLRQERLYRKLFQNFINTTLKNPLRENNIFDLNVSKYNDEVPNLLCVMISFPTFLIYCSIMIMIALLYFNFF